MRTRHTSVATGVEGWAWRAGRAGLDAWRVRERLGSAHLGLSLTLTLTLTRTPKP